MEAVMKPTRQPGWWYPWIFVAFFGVVFSVNGLLFYFAYSSWTGLETREHYVKGLKYNEYLAATKAQEDLGWTVGMTTEAKPTGLEGRTVLLTAVFIDKDGTALNELTTTAYFVSPTHEDYDTQGMMMAEGNGRYVLKLEVPRAGNWTVRIHAHGELASYQHVERVVLP